MSQDITHRYWLPLDDGTSVPGVTMTDLARAVGDGQHNVRAQVAAGVLPPPKRVGRRWLWPETMLPELVAMYRTSMDRFRLERALDQEFQHAAEQVAEHREDEP